MWLIDVLFQKQRPKTRCCSSGFLLTPKGLTKWAHSMRVSCSSQRIAISVLGKWHFQTHSLDCHSQNRIPGTAERGEKRGV